MARTNTISGARQTRHQKNTKVRNWRDAAINHAVRLIHAICGLAGSPTLIDEVRADLRADKVRAARYRPCVRLADVGSQLPRHLGPSCFRLSEHLDGDGASLAAI